MHDFCCSFIVDRLASLLYLLAVGVKRYYTYWQWVSRGTILTGSGFQEVLYLLAVGVKSIILTGSGCQEVL